MERDAVRLEEQVLQGVHPRQPQALLDAVGQVGVVEDDVEAEGLRPQGHRRADPAEADDAERVAAYPGAPLRRLPHLEGTIAKIRLFGTIIAIKKIYSSERQRNAGPKYRILGNNFRTIGEVFNMSKYLGGNFR